MFDIDNSYSAVNTARSALSMIMFNNGISTSNSPIIKRFMKKVHELRPPVICYEFIWNVNVVVTLVKIFI